MSQKKARRKRQKAQSQRYSGQQWTAYHEAAHAVANVGNGIPFTAIHLADDSGKITKSNGEVITSSVGLVETPPNDFMDDYLGNWRTVPLIVSYLAGICADKIISPFESYEKFIVEKGSAGDWLSARHIYKMDHRKRCFENLSDAEADAALSERFLPFAQSYVRSNWQAVTALGDALLLAPDRKLTYEQCCAVLGFDGVEQAA